MPERPLRPASKYSSKVPPDCRSRTKLAAYLLDSRNCKSSVDLRKHNEKAEQNKNAVIEVSLQSERYLRSELTEDALGSNISRALPVCFTYVFLEAFVVAGGERSWVHLKHSNSGKSGVAH